MDILAKILFKVYIPENSQKHKYFSDFFKTKKYLNILEDKHLEISEIIKQIGDSKERGYVRKYCNEIKHEQALFSSGATIDINFDDETVESGFKIKVPNSVKKNKKMVWLKDWAPQLEEYHRKKLVDIGELINVYLRGSCKKVDNNMLSYLNVMLEINC